MERTLNNTKREMLALERFFPHHWREKTEQILFALSIFFLSFSVLFSIAIDTRFGVLWPIFEGLFLFTFALLLVTILIELYFHSLRLRLEKEHEISLETLLVIGLHHPNKKDLAKAFLHSRLGGFVMDKLGVARESVAHFLHTKQNVDLIIPRKGFFPDLAGYLYDEDPYFQDFLERVKISKDHLVKASEVAEKKRHHILSSRLFLHHAFRTPELPVFSLEHTTRVEIDELERFYHIIITEQATTLIVDYFKQDLIHFVSEDERISFLTEVIEWCLDVHRSRFHGASVIMPADIRHFLIHKKAVL